MSGLFSGELGSEKMQSWEDQNVQMKRVGWITPYNRGHARSTMFHKAEDDDAFEQTLAEGRERDACRMLAYQFMPNHWRFVL